MAYEGLKVLFHLLLTSALSWNELQLQALGYFAFKGKILTAHRREGWVVPSVGMDKPKNRKVLRFSLESNVEFVV